MATSAFSSATIGATPVVVVESNASRTAEMPAINSAGV